MRVSSASFLADGAGGVDRPHPAAGRFRRRLAVALYRRPAAAAAESRDRPGPGTRRRRGASRAPRPARHAPRRLRVPGPGGVAVPHARPALHVTLADRAATEGFVREHGMRERFVALAPGSIWGSKRWPYYRELAERLAASVGILVVGGPEDAGLAAEITEAVARSGGQAVSGCGRLSVRQAAEAIRRAVVLVTNDSAPLHFAQAVDTPTVAIFGSTVPSFGFGPRGPRDRVVQVGGLACRPCSAHGPSSCPLGHHLCMKSLSVQDVLQAIEETGALRRQD